MRQEKYKQITKALNNLGFTELEANIYCYLVENSPATAYRIAQDIGKPVANTYKTVQSLYQKGAILIDETQNRLCQAVPPKEVLDKLKNSFLEQHRTAEDALSRLKLSGDTEKIFSLATPEQVFDRCQKLIEQAETVILVDAFPKAVEIIKPWIEAAAARKVVVIAQTYEPTEIKDVETIPFQNAELMLERWHGQWLIVVVDGAEYLFAFLSDDGKTVHNAIWCGSAFLALPQHSNLAHSFRASLVEDLIKNGASLDKIQKELERTKNWLTIKSRGYNKLTAEFSKS